MNTRHGPIDPDNPSGFISKKCPECMEYMPLNAEICPSCKLPVGKMNKHGMATRKTDWKGYGAAIAAWTVFFWYIWWAFIREP